MSIAEKLTTIAENEQRVYEAGKQAEYDDFWNALQENGKRANYSYAFANWKDENFNPKYPFGKYVDYYTGSAPNFVMQYMFRNAQITDLSARMSKLTDPFVFNNLGTTSTMGMFYMSNITKIPKLRFGAVDSTVAVTLNTIFYNCKKLVTIEEIYVRNNSTFTNCFSNCSALENIKFAGVIGQNGLNLQWSPNLTHDSLSSIIECLEDKSKDTSGTVWKVTVGSTNYAKLTTEDLAQIEAKGWVFE